jgi:ParB family transcriptional regulator, chromosome partitioning protein
MLPVGIERVKIEEIKIGQNRRPVKENKVSELMESIRASGLLNPITLDQDLNLVAGLHRLTACKLLGLEQINCNIITCEDFSQARLAEIDENLIRSELEALERAELWLERDRILEQMGLRARRGDNQHTPKKIGRATNARPLKTTVELAREAGYTKRTFQQGKQIARSIVPEVKNLIKGTSIAESPTKLLKLAKAGQAERERAEQAETAVQQAQAAQQLKEAAQQAQIAQAARVKQRELQLAALQGLILDQSQKLTVKGAQPKMQSLAAETLAAETFNAAIKIKANDQWLLYRHSVYCGDTASTQFKNSLPSHAALAIAYSTLPWQHDYLIDEARVVAVLRPAGHIDQFCKLHRMPIRFELLIGGLYVAICSHQPIPAPQPPIDLESVTGVVEFLVAAYTKSGNFVLAPTIGEGEILMACERMHRICFVGDQDPVRVSRAIARWQVLTDKQPQKIT